MTVRLVPVLVAGMAIEQKTKVAIADNTMSRARKIAAERGHVLRHVVEAAVRLGLAQLEKGKAVPEVLRDA